MISRFLVVCLAGCSVPSALAASYYPERLDDAKATYLTAPTFAVHADGRVDDTAVIQQAIDQEEARNHEGIVFIPSGRYRLSHTIYVWPGIRLIGYGPTRPVFTVAPSTPFYQNGPAYMVFFAGDRPSRRSNISGAIAKIADANPGTFYSALSNVDIEIQAGNPGAVGVRGRYAQHCYLAHMDFHIGSGLAGIHDGGNVAQDVHFFGGQYGIWTKKPSPGWQFSVIDATFDGQRVAAIREHEAGLTLIRPQFRHVPSAVEIDPGYADELWVKDARLEDISGPAFVISNEHNAHTEINMEGVVCQDVRSFALFRVSGKRIDGAGALYDVKVFSHGLHFRDAGDPGTIQDVFDASALTGLPAPVASDIVELPPMNTWVNVRSLGARGDGITDDTEVLKKAIAAHRTLYFPSGQYLVTDTIQLKPDTVLVGLHPSITRILIADSTPAFQGVGEAKPLIETPQQGTNIVTGIGLYTNGINPRAVAAKWMAGSSSMMNDVRFLGGHGTSDLTPVPNENHHGWSIYNNTHTADSNIKRRWNAQYPSLWVTNGGGGTFVNIWTPSTFAQAGLYISNTSTPGRVYELSSEHHVRNEVMVRHASNWNIYALQTEEESGEGPFALPIEVQDSSNITFANYHSYRVVSTYQPFPYAVKVTNSRDIHFRNFHCYSDSKASFDNGIYDETHHVEIRDREFSWLDISGLDISGDAPAAEPEGSASAIVQPGATVQKLAGGFFNGSGGAVGPSGDPYFVDARWNAIYRWNESSHFLTKVRDNPLEPVNLAFDKSGDLLVVSYAGKSTVYAIKPESRDESISILTPQASAPRPGMAVVLPVDYWRSENDFSQAIVAPRPWQFISPDGSVFIPVKQDFIDDDLYYGIRMQDVVRAFGLSPTMPGAPFYVSDESEEKTWRVTVGADGAISNPVLFAEQGGEGGAVDADGNVYLAAGQVFVYDAAGKRVGEIKVPERPLQLLFGGSDGKTLYILTHTSLYSVRTMVKGR
ncbi:Gluconolactonase [Acidisarcina polymorpha]|uniref:Gluconolactonase n=1 Tax=Acidisarcina polymorpha TaxID=2211140 RepID=A0A2Z5FXX4_9BACT|nr:glycosyl hydrolase family 28-related protein [Acidisarcina polymorpha]AXC11711.1 Gluconolactonase [Acidisarcina polymorpha]